MSWRCEMRRREMTDEMSRQQVGRMSEVPNDCNHNAFDSLAVLMQPAGDVIRGHQLIDANVRARCAISDAEVLGATECRLG
jgi:hypothetical protein